jgi:hypothetical protein
MCGSFESKPTISLRRYRDGTGGLAHNKDLYTGVDKNKWYAMRLSRYSDQANIINRAQMSTRDRGALLS